jgi:hypothetical protein
LSVAKRAANEFPVQKEAGHHTLMKKEKEKRNQKKNESQGTEVSHAYSLERGLFFTAFDLNLLIIVKI